MSFTAKVSTQGKDLLMSIEGVMDENCELPAIPAGLSGELRIDLQKLLLINSLGARKWVTWILRGAEAKGGVVLLNCPAVFVHQINILAGFLPDFARVESFYAPYYCDSCGFEDSVLYVRGKDFDANESRIPESRPCPSCGGQEEFDMVLERYLKFIYKKTA